MARGPIIRSFKLLLCIAWIATVYTFIIHSIPVDVPTPDRVILGLFSIAAGVFSIWVINMVKNYIITGKVFP